MAKRHERFGVAVDPICVDRAGRDVATYERGSEDFGPDRERLPLWRRASSRPHSTIVRAGALERGDQALINGGTFQRIAWIMSDETPDRCVIGTEAGMRVRLWTQQLIVTIR